MGSLRRLLVVAVGLLALWMPPPARADSYTAPDPAGDVLYFYDGWVPAPEQSGGDIVSSTADFRERKVTFELHHRALVDPASEDLVEAVDYQFWIRTSRHRTYVLHVLDYEQSPNLVVLLERPSGAYVRCGTGAVDLASATVWASVPWRCLRYPRWIRAGMHTEEDFFRSAWVDDALADGQASFSAVAFGPRLHRG